MQEKKYKTIGRCAVSGSPGATITNVTYTKDTVPIEEWVDADRLIVLSALELSGIISSLTEVTTRIRHDGDELVKYKGIYMIPEIRDERIRAAFRPTPQEAYEAWKNDFDEWTG